MTPTIQPLNKRVLLKPVVREAKQGPIIIPESCKEKPIEQEVVAVCPGCKLKPGDVVLISEFAGNKIKVEGQELRFVLSDEILGKLIL